ncbi:MAG: S41 family peptidase [Candidatus Acidiferrales bacterium]|jgi:carboxyl-terminal processing protease
MSRLTKQIALALSILVIAYVAAGYVMGRSTDDKIYRSLTVYSEVLEHVQKDYVEDPDVRQVTIGALHGLLDSLDPDSSYLSPLEYQDYKEKSQNKAEAGAGVALSKHNGYIIVISVLPDSPAQKANLHTGDYLESIAGFTTSQMAIGQAQVLLNGPAGSTVKLAVIRRTKVEPEDVDLVLAKTPDPKIVEDRINGDIAYLRLPLLDTAAVSRLRDKLVQVESKGAHKLVLDLRDCAIGTPADGIAAAQLFVPTGTITSLKGQTVAEQTFSADASKVVWKEPVTLLISGGTAGAAEVLAGAIGDNHRGETIGDRTFGTASFQKVIQLEDGAALILTVADYYTPAGKSIATDGVTPTIQETADDLAALNDLQQSTAPPPGQVASPEDPLLKKAIDVLEGRTVKKAA